MNGKRIVERKSIEGRGKGEEEIRGGQKREEKKRNASQGLRGGEKKKRRGKKKGKKKLSTESNPGPTDERTQ